MESAPGNLRFRSCHSSLDILDLVKNKVPLSQSEQVLLLSDDRFDIEEMLGLLARSLFLQIVDSHLHSTHHALIVLLNNFLLMLVQLIDLTIKFQ